MTKKNSEIKILVTGAAGFIGSHVAKALANKDYTVYGLTLSRAKCGSRVHCISGDIQKIETLSRIMKRYRINTVFHFAALLPHYDNPLNDPFHVFSVNSLGTLNILNAAYRHDVKQFIYASTMSVYEIPPSSLPVDEEHTIKPATMYGASKLSGELYCHAYGSAMDITVLRYGGVYGMGQHEHNAVLRFIKQAKQNEPITIYGSGKQSSDFTFIDDIVDGTLLAFRKNKPGIYNLGSSEETSIKKLAEKIIAATKSKSKIIFTGKDTDRPFRFFLNSDKARRDFGYRPRSLEEGIAEYNTSFFTTP